MIIGNLSSGERADGLPTWGDRIRYHTKATLSARSLGVTLSVLAGAALTAGTTYALVLRVQHLVATAAVSSDPAVWMQAARTRAYDPCYFGCTNHCGDPNYAYNACAKTAAANVSGVVCDGNRMWNWKDRYPIECLQALGEIYQAEDLAALKESYRNQLGITVLTVLGGLVGALVVYKLWKRVTARMRQRAEQERWVARQWPRAFDAAPWSRSKRAARKVESEAEKAMELPIIHSRYEYDDRGDQKPPPYTRNRGPSGWKLITTGFLALFTRPFAAKAYPCTGHDSAYSQYFVDGNHSVFGEVHGWYSNCYDVQVCHPDCTTSCITNSNGGNSCSTSCTSVCFTETRSDKAPQAFVEDVMPRVKACGFQSANAVEGDVNVRVANAGIERNWLVRIGVNGYNVTRANETDELVWCLHDIGSK